MAEEQIKITVGADTSQLNAELTKAQNNLKLFQAALAKSTNVKEIEYLQRSISGLEKQIGSLSGQLGNKLSSSSGQATNALTNLNRVVSDAPYGFIGIANNLNPLVESFGRLKAETGSTGGAFKALLSSLTGPAGIGIAVAAITSAITFAQIGFDRWGASAKKAKEQADEFKKSQEDFTKSLDQAKSSALSTAMSLQQYVDIAKNGQLPLSERNAALKEANKILGEHGDKLTLVNINTQKTTETVALFTKALIAQAIATKYTDRIAELTIQQTNLNQQLKQSNLDVANAAAALNKKINETEKANKNATYSANSFGGATAQSYSVGKEVIDAYNNALNNQKNIQSKLSQTTNEINNLQSQLTTSTKEASDAFGQLGYKAEESKKNTKKTVETIDSVIAKLKEDLKDAINVGIALNEPSIKERIGLITSAITKLVSDFNVDPNSSILVDIKSELNELEFIQNAQENFKQAQLATKKFKFGITIPILPKIDINKPIAIPKELVDFSEAVKGFVTDLAVNISSTLSDALVGAMTGTSTFGDFFQNILSVLGQSVEAFGKQLVKLGVLALVAKLSLEQSLTNPYALIAAGVALAAFGSLLANTRKKQAFAVGTNYAPGGMALVGERGPEMVSLPRGARVTPAAQTAQMFGGAMQQVEVFGVLRGQDIYFSNKKYSQTYRRTT